MDIKQFAQFLELEETEYLDFKMNLYKLSGLKGDANQYAQSELAKDVVSMFNTPRKDSAYLILGVKKHPGEKPDLVGVDKHPDDAVIHEILCSWLDPCPTIIYHPISYKGKDFGVIEIPLDRSLGWVMPKKDYKKTLESGKLYYRKSTKNTVADQSAHKKITNWFESGDYGPLIGREINDYWNEFEDFIARFSKGYYYFLAVSPIPKTEVHLAKPLGIHPWSYVFDFDENSDSEGLLSKCREDLENTRSLHITTISDFLPINPNNSCQWYFSAGLSSRHDTVLGDDSTVKEWRRKYARDIRRRVADLASVTLPKPSILIVYWEEDQKDPEYLRAIIESCDEIFGSQLSVVIVTPEASGTVNQLASLFGAKHVVIPAKEFFHGISALSRTALPSLSDCFQIPSSSGAPITIENAKWQWLSESLEVVGLHIGVSLTDSSEAELFLRGADPSWGAISDRADVERSVQARLDMLVNERIQRRRAHRLNLYHEAGAGGTTLARRILWDRHKNYPCVSLLSTDPRDVADRLAFLVSESNLPIVAIVDSSVVGDIDTDPVFERLRADHLPVVLLQISRVQEVERQGGASSVMLRADLDKEEAIRLVNSLAVIRPEREEVLKEAISDDGFESRTPFYLSLLAFERDFLGIERYVDQRLEGLPPIQQKVLEFLAISHYYGQKSVSADLFRTLLALPIGKPVHLEEVLPKNVIHLLVMGADLNWRTTHPLIAERILVRLLSAGASDTRIWKQKLSTVAKEFADFCRGDTPEPFEEGTDLAYQVFIARGTDEYTEESRATRNIPHSRLVNDIPSIEGKKSVLQYLTDVFPEDPHVWAHYGRFLSLVLKENADALNALRISLSIYDGDPLLWHMRGMIERNQAYDSINEREGLEEVLKFAEQASISFAKARSLQPHNDHGYISEVQLIIRALDYAASVNNSSALVASTNSSNTWLREAFGRAEDMLSEVRRNHQGEPSSYWELRCRADLTNLYGDFSKALQQWDSLLQQKEVFAPPVRRQIVWAHLARHERNWEKLSRKEIRRIYGLLEENLEQDGGASADYRNWIQACRYLQPVPDLDSVIEKVAYWRMNSDSLDAVYYLYVLYALKALEGATLAGADSIRLLEECRQMARLNRNRSRSYEWYGKGTGISRLVHFSQLNWSERGEFWEDVSQLQSVSATIRSIRGSQAGELELTGGLSAFFVPGKSGHYKGHSENRKVSCYLGFSYDGLRAWSVTDKKIG